MIRTRYNVVVPRGEMYLTMHLVYNLARCPYPNMGQTSIFEHVKQVLSHVSLRAYRLKYRF